MKRLLLALALLTIPTMASADQRAIRQKLATLVDNLGLDASRSFTVSPCDANGYCYSTLVLSLNHSTHDAASAIAMTCTTSLDSGTTNATLQDCDVASGACTSNDASWTKAISGVKAWPWRVDVAGYPSVTCTITDTGGGAGDKITVLGLLVTE